ncbi:CG13613 [Drosophila busckii]|uniref:CG13613 n=2 Tax=Drosophila busckii TaxID=30019 RepID=A0A0M4EG57_DROBS|nr:CG13613 [Drosophila busckii]
MRLLLIFSLLLIGSIHGYLLFPASTVLQLTSSMSVPMDLPKRVVFMDLGFQMNYNLPFELASFYNPAIWANAYERRHKRQSLNYTAATTNWQPNDYTAGELYAALEQQLQDYGFHSSCLLRCVCELALHPFADNQSLLVQIINLLLTPSQHEGFAAHEHAAQQRFEQAERLGFMGGDCQRAYAKCELDILGFISRLVS